MDEHEPKKKLRVLMENFWITVNFLSKEWIFPDSINGLAFINTHKSAQMRPTHRSSLSSSFGTHVVVYTSICLVFVCSVAATDPLTPSSLPCSRWTAPARRMPARNHTGCVRNRRSTRPRSHGGPFDPSDDSEEVSPSARIPPSELLTNDVRDCKWQGMMQNCD